VNSFTHTKQIPRQPAYPRGARLIASATFALAFGSGLLAQSRVAIRPDKTEADRAVRLQEFEVTEARTSATTMAPTESRLEATQPESIINLQTIQNSIAPTADYAMIAALAPSVTNFSTNGPGLNESKPIMRRFR